MDTALSTTFKYVSKGLHGYIQHKHRAKLSNYGDSERVRLDCYEVEGCEWNTTVLQCTWSVWITVQTGMSVMQPFKDKISINLNTKRFVALH